jgi:hypothetical protein
MFNLKVPKRSIQDINLFHIEKAFDNITEKVRNATRFKNATFIVEVFNDKQTETFLKANLLVHVEKNVSLNSTWRVVATDSFGDMSDKEIRVLN